MRFHQGASCDCPCLARLWVLLMAATALTGCNPGSKAASDVHPVGRPLHGFAIRDAVMRSGLAGQKEIHATVVTESPETRLIAVAFERFGSEGDPLGTLVAYVSFEGRTQAVVAVPVPGDVQGFRFAGAAVAPKPRGETEK